MEQKEYMVEYSDLRLNAPFPELLSYADEFNMDELELDKHSYVPYPVILIKAMQNYQKQHEGNIPKSFKEKNEFKDQFIKT